MLKLYVLRFGKLEYVETFTSGGGVENFLVIKHGRIDTYGINAYLSGGFQYEIQVSER